MEKILKKYTTIPQDLYIKRNADKQLFQIISEMERPGYVLVARQMGKTNLLINAKRELENKNNLFAYVDLSNNFLEERDCYRNIIDSIIEPNKNLFTKTIPLISNNRKLENIQPHKEYTQELRLILSEFGGKLIIILDEIDALRSVDYSDHIFAQIRSNYFARTNFPEFKNLTYVLSGVVEPTELIKDKNKSPFNIGEKIYLDDFNYDEHREFILKSKLDISDDIVHEIYSWTNGNPRLTFDICSDVEDLIISNHKISILDIELIVNKKYLRSFDVAPIDHIRDIVTKNKNIRKAIQNIYKGRLLSGDEIKRKLYLYGIISSNYNSNEIKIKNRIIEKSLSLDWLDSIDRQNQDLFSLGLDKIDNAEYKEAISILNEYLSNSDVPVINRDLAFYNIGFAYYKLGDLKQSLNTFNNHSFDSNSESKFQLSSKSKSFIGICCLGLGNYEKGLKVLEEVIDEAKDVPFAYNNALLNLGSYYLQKEPDRALILFDLLLDSINLDETSTENDKLKVLAFAYKSQIYYNKKRIEDALVQIISAKEIANESDKIELFYFEYILKQKADSSLLNQIVRGIIDNNLTFNSIEKYEISFSEFNNYQYLVELYRSEQKALFNELLDYTTEKLYLNSNSRFEILYTIASYQSDLKYSSTILYEILNNKSLLNEELLYKTYKYLAIIEPQTNKNYESLFEHYSILFAKSLNNIDLNDISAFTFAIKYYSDKFNFEKSLQLCKLIESKFIDLTDTLNYESIIIYYWHTNTLFSKKDKKEAYEFADKTLSLIVKYKGVKGSFIDEKGIQIISNQMNQIKNSSISNKPIIRIEKKFNRNDRVKVKYKDNSIKEGKYKNFEADIISERCVIL